MRILFTFAGGAGHFIPLSPLARAMEARGHVVAVSGQPMLLPIVEREGFTAFATGGNTFHGDSKRMPLLKLNMQREYRVVRKSYAGRIARSRASTINELCTKWKPDLLVCDEMDFGCMIAAERLSIPYATVLVIATGALTPRQLIAESLNELRAEHGLAADPDLLMLSRYLVLSPFPPSLRDPAFPLPSTALSFCPAVLTNHASRHRPEWLARLPYASTIYLTLGTVFNVESGDLFNRLLTGLKTLPINVVVTVGPQIDPQEIGRQPQNVHIEKFIDQWSLLPHCDLVVSHAGSGTVLGALAHGLPMVLVPMGADQPLNAKRCEELKVAQVLDPIESTPEVIREAVSAVRTDLSYRQAAEHIRTEIAALPNQNCAVSLLERLATTKIPVVFTD